MSLMSLGAGIGSRPFIFTVNTANAGSASTHFIVPFVSTGTYDCLIDWGDGSSSAITTWNNPALDHTYGSSGVYTIKITGICKGFRFANAGDRRKILTISQWGNLNLGNDNGYFFGCTSLLITATDTLNLQGTTIFDNAFRQCTALTTIPNLSLWDVSAVTTLGNAWNLCTSFNGDPSGWTTTSLQNAAACFNLCSSFERNIGGWDVRQLTNATNLFGSNTIDTVNWSGLLVGWAAQSPLQTGVVLGGGSSKYNAGAVAARGILTGAPNLWTITDGGLE